MNKILTGTAAAAAAVSFALNLLTGCTAALDQSSNSSESNSVGSDPDRVVVNDPANDSDVVVDLRHIKPPEQHEPSHVSPPASCGRAEIVAVLEQQGFSEANTLVSKDVTTKLTYPEPATEYASTEYDLLLENLENIKDRYTGKVNDGNITVEFTAIQNIGTIVRAFCTGGESR